jgi:hypothetical protein
MTILVASVAVMAMAFDVDARGRGKGKGKRGKGWQGQPAMGQGMMNRDMQPGDEGFGPGPKALGIDLKLRKSDKLRAAMEEVAAQHLYDTLNLTAAQKKALKQNIDEVRELRSQADVIRTKYENLMIDRIKAMPKGKQSDEVRIQQMKAMHKLRREYREATRDIRERAIEVGKSLAGIITKDQYQALQNMPRLFQKAMEQETDNPWALAFVDRLRLMPQQRFEKMKARSGKRMNISEEQRNAFFAQIEHIRSLSAEDYEANRAELAAAIDPAIVEMIQQRRGGKGKGMGKGRGQGQGMGRGMGPGDGSGPGMGRGQGMGPGDGMAPGPRMGRGKHMMRKGHLWRIITSDAFYNLLK